MRKFARVVSLVSIAFVAGLAAPSASTAQVADTTSSSPAVVAPGDTAVVQGAIYNRPYIGSLGGISLGGYVEWSGSYLVEEGITEGLSFDLRRFNLFVFSGLGPRLSFTSELEFEHGTEEIELETALVDFVLDPAFVIRAGVFVVPIGAFNQNHDSPRYEFATRPLVATEIIPSTLSDVGFGVHGRLHRGRRPVLALGAAIDSASTGSGGLTLTYDIYLSNGLGGDIFFGPEERTRIANGKTGGRLGSSPSGRPSLSGRVALHGERMGEIGISYFGGVYNRDRVDGEVVDRARRVSIQALDYAGEVGPVRLRGEVARASIEVPADLREIFGHRQWGGYLDLVAPVVRARLFGARDAAINAALRLEYVDYNVGKFASTGQVIGDEVLAIVPALSFRPVPNTVFQFNYRREWARDLFRNPTTRLGGFQVGVATYF